MSSPRSSGLTPEQLEMRRTGVGASEVSAIAGEDPTCSAWDVWLDKVGARIDPDDVPGPTATEFEWRLSVAERGTEYEDNAARRYQVLHPDLVVVNPLVSTCPFGEVRGTFRHPKHGFALASPDRLVWTPEEQGILGQARLLECKTAHAWLRGEWGKPGTDQVPIKYYIQAQWQMLVLGARRVDVPVLLGWDLYRQYVVLPDAEMQAGLLELVGKFWRDNVLGRTEPMIDGSDACRQYLVQRFPKPTAPRKVAPPEAAEIAQRLQKAQGAIKTAREVESQAKAMLMETCGDAAGLDGDGFKVSWYTVNDSIVPEHVRKGGRQLRVTFSKGER